MTTHARLFGFFLGGVTLLNGRIALADDPTKQECIDADTESQSLRSDDKLKAAREKLQICSNSVCPSIVRDDCAKRVDELNLVQPSLVISARSGAGKDLVQVHVTMDGAPLTDTLDGRAFDIDPGDHTFTFEISGEKIVTEHFLVRETEKNRREVVTIGKAPKVAPLFANDDPNRGRTQRVLGIAAAGVGVLGIGLGAVFGLSAKSSWNTAQNECSAASCPSATRDDAASDRSSALTKGTVSTVAFIGGGVLVAGGAVLFFTASKSKGRIQVGMVPNAGGATVVGSF